MLTLFLAATGYLLSIAAITLAVYAFLSSYYDRTLLRSRLRPALKQSLARSHSQGSGIERLLGAATLRRLRSSFDERRAVSGFPLSWNGFLMLSGTTAILGMVFGTAYFNNFLAGIALMIMGLLLPDQVLSLGAGAHKDRTHEQLQLAIQVFGAEYRSSRSVQRAFLGTVPQLPEPIRHHFERCARRLNSGEPHEQVLEELAFRLQHPFARLFVTNCKAVMESQQAAPLFDMIAYQLNQWRIRQTANAAALSGGRMLGLLLNAALPAVYFVNLRLQPATKVLLTETSGGRAMVVLMLLGVLVTFGLNKFLAKADW